MITTVVERVISTPDLQVPELHVGPDYGAGLAATWSTPNALHWQMLLLMIEILHDFYIQQDTTTRAEEIRRYSIYWVMQDLLL